MPSIRDFSGGVVNQELQNRDNGAGVLFDCKNVISSWNGELRKRTGTKFLKDYLTKSIIIPYRLPSGDDIILLLSRSFLTGYMLDPEDNLQRYTYYIPGAAISFPTEWSSNTSGDWSVNANGGNSSLAYKAVLNQDFPYDDIYVRGGGAYYTIENSQTSVVLMSFHVTWVSFGGLLAGTEPVLYYSDDGHSWTGLNTKISNVSHASSGSSHAYNYDVAINAQVSSHRYWRVSFGSSVSEGSSTRAYLRLSNIKFVEGVVSDQINLVHNYKEEDLDNIRFAQNGDILTVVCKGKEVRQLKLNDNRIYTFDVFRPEDEAGIWTANDYPSSVCYYQNRLWFGGFELHPTRVWGSAFGDFTHFSIPSPIAATSPIKVDGTEITSIIENMFGGNNALYCLSEDGISMIDAQNAMVATNQIEFKLRNREPVSSVTPTVKDDIMIYVGRDRRKLLITDYDFVVQRFKSICISDNYIDFFKSGIKEIHYIPNTQSLIYGSLYNGKYFALLFDNEKRKNALYPFESYGGIIDMQPIKIGNVTKLLFITSINQKYFLELKNPKQDIPVMDFMSKSEKEEYTKNVLTSGNMFLDHSFKRLNSSPVLTLGSLPNFYTEGSVVDVIVDGIMTKKTVKNSDWSLLYRWYRSTALDVADEYIYTNTTSPAVGSNIYDINNSQKSDYNIIRIQKYQDSVFRITVDLKSNEFFYAYTYEGNIVYSLSKHPSWIYDEEGEFLDQIYPAPSDTLIYQGNTYNRDSSFDKYMYAKFTIDYDRDGETKSVSNKGYIELDEAATEVSIGCSYDSYAVLKFVSPYNMRKFPKEISVNFINSGYLELGNTFESLRPIKGNLIDTVSINNKPILINGNYTMTFDKQTFETPYVIVRSDKPMPFIITGMDYKVDMSNYQGGV